MSWDRAELQGLKYRFHHPGPGQWPVILFLHGSGERGDDNASHLKNGVELLAAWPAIVVAPQCPRDTSWGGSWYGGPTPQQAQVVELVKELAGRASVDAGRISVVGFSMGAIGGWELVARHRALFSAFVPIAGDVEVESAKGLSGFPIWAFHGGDDPAVPHTNIREIAKRGYVTKYTEFPGVGHLAGQPALSTPHLQEWLLAQRRA